jgi:hypothetical protein
MIIGSYELRYEMRDAIVIAHVKTSQSRAVTGCDCDEHLPAFDVVRRVDYTWRLSFVHSKGSLPAGVCGGFMMDGFYIRHRVSMAPGPQHRDGGWAGRFVRGISQINLTTRCRSVTSPVSIATQKVSIATEPWRPQNLQYQSVDLCKLIKAK